MKTFIKTLIVDDEPLARDNIRILLEKDTEIFIAAEAKNGIEASGILKNQKIDLLFLDIQMPGMNGFQLLSDIKTPELPVVIFVTAYDKYAIQAFQVHALDYLLKPYSDEAFYKALRNAKQYINLKNNYTLNEQLKSLLDDYSRNSTITADNKKYIQRIAVTTNNKTLFVKVDDLDWIESADYYVKLHTGTKTYLLRESMSRLEEQLDPDMFIRVHRSSIINIEKIKEIENVFNGDCIIILSNGARLKLSKSRKKFFKEKLHINSD